MIDVINALLNIASGFILFANVKRLIHDKTVQGVFWGVTLFFFFRSLWHMGFYFSLGQYYSAIGELVPALANGMWIVLFFYYKRKANE